MPSIVIIVQCYDPPIGHKCLYEAFLDADCKAPVVGLPLFCLGHVTSSMLSSVEDHMEDCTGVEAVEYAQAVTASGLLVPVPTSANSSNMAEGRYFGPNGGGRGYNKHGWAGGVDNFPQGNLLMIFMHILPHPHWLCVIVVCVLQAVCKRVVAM